MVTPLSRLQQALAAHQPVLLEALPPSGLAYVLATLALPPTTLIVTPDADRAERVYVDLRGFGVADVCLLPGDENTPFDDSAPDPQAVAQRLSLRHRLHSGHPPQVIVTTAAAMQGRWMPHADFIAASATYTQGQEVDRQKLAAQLTYCGYQAVSVVDDEGTYALRGGVVDVFVPGWARPVRLDLFGDELASLKTFAPDTQRTYDALPALHIFPIREVLFCDASVMRAQAFLRELAENVAIPSRRIRTLVEEIEQRHYFYGVEALWPAFYAAQEAVADTLLPLARLLVVDAEPAVHQAFIDRWAQAEKERARALEHQMPAVAVEAHLSLPARLQTQFAARPQLRTTPLALHEDTKPLPLPLRDWSELSRELSLRRTDVSRGEILDPVVQELQRRMQAGDTLYFACSSRGHAERLRELLLARRIDLPVLDALPAFSAAAANARARQSPGFRAPPRAAIAVAALGSGLIDAATGIAILTDVELFAAPPKRLVRGRKRASREGLSTLRDLRDGDFVIHQDHGIGRYLGLKRLILNGVDGDYVHLEYADNDKLYVPVYRLSVLQAYRGPAEHARLDKLGGNRWMRAKERVKDAVLAIAHELLALQAQRRALPGFALPAPDEHFRAFEATFPYEETPDQRRAIDDVLKDLQLPHPMDRLICGDVGFGKTEVAMRGAFLAVMAGRQVAILVPTTVLAEQHRLTFAERLKSEGIVVEVLSRFRSAKESRAVLERLRQGQVDILVGTHRLLSPDVAFKNLGLLVVDEEQRFGVKHKERIKQLRSHVHVLTLSATPIPRTMHMASLGLRDLSIIQTPPAERSSIRTEVLRFDEEVMTQAIRRELTRGGQVFVVHNRVQSIEAMAHLVRRLTPEAQVGVAHGQMSAEALERIMVDFVRREYHVLVCTAIIESGIDIPSANTMIVNRADTFGLSQLYQLRGRIGRGRDRAYAYLMLPRADKIGQDATARLAVLKRFSELGAGFQIATHDLELRGAGDLLGADQSGNIAAVGFDLYTTLLSEAVERARGQTQRHAVEPDIKLPVVAVLPESYIPEPMARLDYYQRMAQASSDAAIFDICNEIKDVYGAAPPEVDALADVMVIRRRLKALGASALSVSAGDDAVKISLAFVPEAPVDRADLVQRCQSAPSQYRLLPSGRLAIILPGQKADDVSGLLRHIRMAVGELRTVGSSSSVERRLS